MNRDYKVKIYLNEFVQYKSRAGVKFVYFCHPLVFEVTTHENRLVQVSDSSYQIILKFQSPPSSARGGVIVNYETFKM
jgi:hypothetical protein